ncbi:nitric oxide synthase oxygenase [Kitasatospora sp. NPDC097643]|uniref:nitric oxide synthase oxygenase n=1 Tax=Kitasatospora sp. NPDC097643 TaxID=3157230 RepID=UPI0033312A71
MAEPAGVDIPGVLARAEEFIRLFHRENATGRSPADRMAEIRREVRRTGSYTHTAEELAFGARVAWRNSSRCIGRLYWQSLVVRDLRHLRTAEELHRACVDHLRTAFNGGRIRPMISVFAADGPDGSGPRIHNAQLIRYAGYRGPDGRITGDPAGADLTDRLRALGWPGGPGTRFDPLPLLIQTPAGPPGLFDLPPDAVREVPLRHPDYDWFADLGLRWYALPVISDLTLEIGGVRYGAAPFNGWYMGTEIGARNLVDEQRYDLLPELADRMGLDRGADHTLWKDRALVEMNVAVLWSFQQDGIAVTDHHTESRRFLRHLEREEKAGRAVPADWSWIVPPLSAGTTPVFHRYYDDFESSPAFLKTPAARRCPVLGPAPTTGGVPDEPDAQPLIGAGAVANIGDRRDRIARP